MYPVFESIQYKDGTFCNLDYHIARMQQTCIDLWGEKKNMDGLKARLKIGHKESLQKYKIYYDLHHEFVTYSPYYPRTIKQLYITDADELQYPHKYTDRRTIDHFTQDLPLDTDVLFVQQQLVSDSSYANLAFWDGKQWFTPEQPLLPGTKRAYLIDTSQLIPAPISESDIHYFEKACLINCMLDLNQVCIDTPHILRR